MPKDWPGLDQGPTIIEQMDGTRRSGDGKLDWPGPGASFTAVREPSAGAPESAMTKTGPKIKAGIKVED